MKGTIEKPIQRIEKIIKHYNLSIATFEKLCGLSNGSIQAAIRRKSSITDTTLIKVLGSFPDVSTIWLLLGEGSMFGNEKKSLDDYSVDALVTYMHDNEHKRNFSENPTYKMFIELRTQRAVISKMQEMLQSRGKEES